MVQAVGVNKRAWPAISLRHPHPSAGVPLPFLSRSGIHQTGLVFVQTCQSFVERSDPNLSVRSKTGATGPGLYSFKILRSGAASPVLDRPIMFLTTMAAMPASTALAIGDDSMSVIGFDPGAWA